MKTQVKTSVGRKKTKRKKRRLLSHWIECKSKKMNKWTKRNKDLLVSHEGLIHDVILFKVFNGNIVCYWNFISHLIKKASMIIKSLLDWHIFIYLSLSKSSSIKPLHFQFENQNVTPLHFQFENQNGGIFKQSKKLGEKIQHIQVIKRKSEWYILIFVINEKFI